MGGWVRSYKTCVPQLDVILSLNLPSFWKCQILESFFLYLIRKKSFFDWGLHLVVSIDLFAKFLCPFRTMEYIIEHLRIYTFFSFPSRRELDKHVFNRKISSPPWKTERKWLIYSIVWKGTIWARNKSMETTEAGLQGFLSRRKKQAL